MQRGPESGGSCEVRGGQRGGEPRAVFHTQGGGGGMAAEEEWDLRDARRSDRFCVDGTQPWVLCGLRRDKKRLRVLWGASPTLGQRAIVL